MKAVLGWCQGAFFTLILLVAMFGGFVLHKYNLTEHVALGYVEVDSKLYKLVPAEAVAVLTSQQTCPVGGGESCN